MSISGLVPIIGAVVAAVVVAGAIIALLARVLRAAPAGGVAGSGPPHRGAGAVFLFESGVLADATPA